MMILARLWPFKKPVGGNDICPGSYKLWTGKFKRIYSSTSNGLEIHGNGGNTYHYFAKCPICKIPRAIRKNTKTFFRHTRSDRANTPSFARLPSFRENPDSGIISVPRLRPIRPIFSGVIPPNGEPVTPESLGVSEIHYRYE